MLKKYLTCRLPPAVCRLNIFFWKILRTGHHENDATSLIGINLAIYMKYISILLKMINVNDNVPTIL